MNLPRLVSASAVALLVTVSAMTGSFEAKEAGAVKSGRQEASSCIGVGRGSFIGGGEENVAAGTFAGVLVGADNYACGDWSAVAAGLNNRSIGVMDFAGGGRGNILNGVSADSGIVAGVQNALGGGSNGIVAGYRNNNHGANSLVGSGQMNAVGGQSTAVVAGSRNTVFGSKPGTGNYSLIGAGESNTVSAQSAAIAAGSTNYVTGDYGFVGAGLKNFVGGASNFIGAGQGNRTTAQHSAIVGGDTNALTGDYGFIGAGQANVVSGVNAVVVGGFGNAAYGAGSFAAGRGAKAANNGAFVWSDEITTPRLSSTADDQFIVRASGGAYFYSSTRSTGVVLAPGSGSWASLSDRRMKVAIAPIDGTAILQKIAALPVTEWSYTTELGVRHVGPMAQDFRAAFGLGENDRYIATIDEEGVALAAIKELNAQNRELRVAVAREAAEIKVIRAELAKLDGERTSRLAAPASLLQEIAKVTSLRR